MSSQRHSWHPSFGTTLFFGLKYLAGDRDVDSTYIDTLQSPNSPVLHCTWQTQIGYGPAPLPVAEALEQEGKAADAPPQDGSSAAVTRRRVGMRSQLLPFDQRQTAPHSVSPQGSTRGQRRIANAPAAIL